MDTSCCKTMDKAPEIVLCHENVSMPYIIIFFKKKRQSSPVTALEWPRGFQKVKVPGLHDNGTGWWSGYQPYAPAAFTPRK
jgi:hypothetical protein